MIFFSHNGGFRQVLTRSTYRYIKTAGSEYEEKVPVYGVTVEWNPLPGQGIMLKGRMWRGKMDTDEMALKLQRLGREDVTSELLTMALLKHRNYGNEFIAFGEDGEAVEDDALLTTVGDGSYICQACEQVIKNSQGLQGHFGSEKHKANRTAYIDSVRKQFKL